tara:strand:+ start:491 stop:871 length:381 start_codon:yes stop_codon:yes gene_type:complete
LPDVGLENIYIVPVRANNPTGILKSKPYGASTMEKIEKNHIESIDIVFARNDIAPVFKKSFTWRPNKRLFMTKLYRRSDDFTKNVAAKISQIVPGNPGITYPIMPNPKQMSPTVTNNSFLNFSNNK